MDPTTQAQRQKTRRLNRDDFLGIAILLGIFIFAIFIVYIFLIITARAYSINPFVGILIHIPLFVPFYIFLTTLDASAVLYGRVGVPLVVMTLINFALTLIFLFIILKMLVNKTEEETLKFLGIYYVVTYSFLAVFPTFLTPWYWDTFQVIAANLFALAYWIVIYSYLSDLKTPVKPVSLFDAIAKGDLKKIESLLKRGVNPNIRDKDGQTPLHKAAYGGHVAVAKLLLEHGADIHARDNANWTPLHEAAYKGHVDVVRLLLEHGADPNAKGKDGVTPLHTAAFNGHVNVARLLLEHGANPNTQDKDGITPLHFAAFNGHVDVVKLLLERGADPNIQNENGWTPLHWAAFNGHVNVARLLLEHGANPNAQDKDGITPLHTAALNGHVDVVKLLLVRGADPTVKSRSGKTPLDLARKEGYDGVVSLIEEWLWGGWRLSRQREAAEALPPGGSQKAVSPPAPTAQSPPAQSKETRRQEPREAAELVDVVFVDKLSREPITYTPVSFSGSFFDVPELGLSGCVFFRCGAFFCVYRCTWHGAAVAVKVPVRHAREFERGVPYHFTKVPGSVRREINIVKSLHHGNVLRLVKAWPGYGVLAYEWSDGGSLRDQKLSKGDVLKALVHVAWGLHYLHSRGVVHGDVKGDNVMIAGGVCKIGDLASLRRLLRRVSENKPVDIISTRPDPETVTLTAPEQQGGAEVPGFETRVDIYQLANLLLEIIGAETISGERWSEKGVERAAREAEVVGLGGLVKQMLSQKPWERPTAEEVAKRAAAEWKRRYG